LGLGEQPNLDRTIEWTSGNGSVQVFGQLDRAGARKLADQINAGGTRPRPADRSDWEQPDEWLTDDTELRVGDRRLRVIATPGHTRGHVVFHDEAGGLLFAGDHVLPQITPSIGFEPAPVAFPLRDYLDSLRLMLKLPDARLLPAHGPVTASVHRRVQELLDHHGHRLDACAAIVDAGAESAFEVARVLTWTRHERSFEGLDLLNQALAVAETAAHLDVLVLQDRLSGKTDSDGVERYYR
jgi:glyoxylase-like metal-dependent hydrolase (beta-lactamase superfamily II)